MTDDRKARYDAQVADWERRFPIDPAMPTDRPFGVDLQARADPHVAGAESTGRRVYVCRDCETIWPAHRESCRYVLTFDQYVEAEGAYTVDPDQTYAVAYCDNCGHEVDINADTDYTRARHSGEDGYGRDRECYAQRYTAPKAPA